MAHGTPCSAGSSRRATVSLIRSASPGNGTFRVSSHPRKVSHQSTPAASTLDLHAHDPDRSGDRWATRNPVVAGNSSRHGRHSLASWTGCTQSQQCDAKVQANGRLNPHGAKKDEIEPQPDVVAASSACWGVLAGCATGFRSHRLLECKQDVCFTSIPRDMPTHLWNCSGTVDLSGRKSIRMIPFAASHDHQIVCDVPPPSLPH